MITHEAIQVIADLGEKTAEPASGALKLDEFGLEGGLPNMVPVYFDKGVPKSVRDLAEEWRVRPSKWEGTAKADSLRSFCELTNRHKNVDASVVFASTNIQSGGISGPSLTAVIDYGRASEDPTFRAHRIHYSFPISDELKAWLIQDGKALTQGDFAEFLEENVIYLGAPSVEERKHFKETYGTTTANPMDLMALSRGLSVNVEQSVSSHTKLNSGESEISFVEKHTNAKGDAIVVPGMFIISVPAFVGGHVVRIPARLRYRVTAGRLSWSFHMLQWKEIIRERVKADMEIVVEQTGLPCFEGSPE